mmetsp:Transcript_18852/g.23983  ORF Transcript_18852/g.23983 Transcript_18852/m.23983 type:complete len:187 (+) Transcript_18852:180-740(+)
MGNALNDARDKLKERTGLNSYVLVWIFTGFSLFFLLLALITGWYTFQVAGIKDSANLFDFKGFDGVGAIKLAAALLIFAMFAGFGAIGLVFKAKQDADNKFMKFATLALAVGAVMIFVAFISAVSADVCAGADQTDGVECTKFGAGSAMALFFALPLMGFSAGLAFAASNEYDPGSSDVAAKNEEV